MSYADFKPTAPAEAKAVAGTPVYRRILELFEAEGINTLFGIPDPNFVHMFLEAEQRGWTVVAPHHEAAAGFMAEAASRMTGKPAVCIGTLGPGIANAAPAMQCALAENSPVIFLSGQRARVTEQRVRRGRIQFVKQMPLFENSVKYAASIEYAYQTDEIIQQGIRAAMSGTPGPVYIEYPSHVILEELAVAAPLLPARYRLVNQGADIDMVREAAEAIRAAKNPILLVGHAVHTTRMGAAVKELALLMNCPVIQTSGGTSYIEGLEDRTFQYVFSDASIEAVEQSDLCLALGTELGEPVHYGRWRYWQANEAIRKWIYVEQDPTAIGVNRPIDVPLVGDLRGVVPQLVTALKNTPRPPGPGLAKFMKDGAAELAELAAESRTKSDGTGDVPIHTSQFVVQASGAFPRDGIADPRRRRHGDLPVDVFAVQAARCDLEPELRPYRHRAALRHRRDAGRPRGDGQGPSGDADQQRFVVHVPHRRAGNRGALQAAAGLRGGRDPRGDRPQSQFRGNAQVRKVPHVVCRRHAVRLNTAR